MDTQIKDMFDSLHDSILDFYVQVSKIIDSGDCRNNHDLSVLKCGLHATSTYIVYCKKQLGIEDAV